MSANDGLSDEEWGAWGKPAETVASPYIEALSNGNTKNGGSSHQNGFGSDEEIRFNAPIVKKPVSPTNNFADNDNREKYNSDRQDNFGNNKRGGYSANRGMNGNRFASRRDDDQDNFKRNKNDNERDFKKKNYADEDNGGYKKIDNHRNGRNDDFKRDDSREKKNYRRKEDFRDDSPDIKGGYRNDRKVEYKRDDSRENRNNYRNNDRKRDDSKEKRNGNRNNDRKGDFNRDDSRENRNTYRNDRKRDDSREDRNTYRNDRKRDDSRENRNNYRFDRKRDDSKENRYSRNDRKNDFNRDDSRDKRNNYRDDRKRDDSRDKGNNYRNDRRRDDSRDTGYKKDDYRRDGSRDNGYRNNKNDDFKRDGSRENRNGYRNDREPCRNRGDSEDHHRGRKNDMKPETNYRRGRNDSFGSDDLRNNFQRTVKVEEEGFSSRTFTRSQKPDEKAPDEPPVPKRATFIPNDDQEDYELHVNLGINFDNYDKIPVDVTGDDIPAAITTLAELQLPEFLVSNIEFMKYHKLTPVQKYAIPIISARRDLMACAQTGSGKTAAFLIPIIKSLHENEVETPSSAVAFPKALIMAPTRELCRQIFTAARQLCKGSNVKCAYIYGGIEMNKSRRNIQVTGCDILVATPGRLIHFLELVWISLKYMKYFVLDEADRMLEAEGFYESVNKIYIEANCVGEDRTIEISMFSATFPNEIQNLARNLLKNYLFLAVGVVGSANTDVKQEIIQSDQREKINTAIEYIKTIPEEKTLIFVESKRMADFFGIKLGYLGFKATTIHGDREQEQREIALNDFKSGRVNFMVATNVAARGLDIPMVDNVINIDMPGDIDTYVHRIGRTGRCGNVGRAISFFDEAKDIGLAGGLVSKLQEANQECPDWLKSLCDGTSVRRVDNYSRDNRKDVRSSKYIDNPKDDGFMKGTNVDYDDVQPSSEWLED